MAVPVFKGERRQYDPKIGCNSNYPTGEQEDLVQVVMLTNHKSRRKRRLKKGIEAGLFGADRVVVRSAPTTLKVGDMETVAREDCFNAISIQTNYRDLSPNGWEA